MAGQPQTREQPAEGERALERAEADGHQRSAPGRVGFSNRDEGEAGIEERALEAQQLRLGVGVERDRPGFRGKRGERGRPRGVNQLCELNTGGNVASDDAVVVERAISCGGNVAGNVLRGSWCGP